MRITFVLGPASLDGGVRVVAIYADRLKRRGHDVLVVSTPVRRPRLRERLRSLLRGRGWFVPATPKGSHLDRVDVEHRVIDRFRPVVDADVPDADVVIATWWETVEWVAGLRDSKGVKVHFMQDYELWGGPTERVDATCRLTLPKIVTSGWLSGILRDRFDQAPIALIPYSVDTDVFRVPPRGKQATPTVGFTYSMMPNKGSDIIIRAYALAQGRIPELRLVSCGVTGVWDGLPLPKGTEYTRRADDPMLTRIYSSCDAWLFGSRREGFGLPILEAMACRTPVIGTPGGAAPDLLPHGGGVLVKPEDPEDMACAIERVCTMPDADWRAMSDRAYATATRYTWADATDRFEAALIEAIEQSRAGAPA